MKRRTFLITSSTLLAGSIISRSSFGAASAAFYLPYQPNWSIPYTLADCNKYRAIIADARAMRQKIQHDNAFVDALIQTYADRGRQLSAEIETLQKEIADKEKKINVGRVAVVVGLVFLIAGVFATTPVAVGTLAGMSIIAGTTVLGFQIAYTNPTGAGLAVGYTKDRALFIGEAIAENAGSKGGKLLTGALSCISLLVEAYGVGEEMAAQEQLRAKIAAISVESAQIASLLKSMPRNIRPVWKGMFDNQLEGTIRSLERFVEAHASTDCRLLDFQTGPVLKQP